MKTSEVAKSNQSDLKVQKYLVDLVQDRYRQSMRKIVAHTVTIANWIKTIVLKRTILQLSLISWYVILDRKNSRL